MVPTSAYKSRGDTVHLGGSQRTPKEAASVTDLPGSLGKQRLGKGGLSRQGKQPKKRIKEHTVSVSFLDPRPCTEWLTWVSSLTRKQRATVPKRC